MLYGALIGDAVGVPYEFKAPHLLPDLVDIDMIPPAVDMNGYKLQQSYDVPNGTWSDDGALTLCLLESLLENNTDEKIWVRKFGNLAVNWRLHGYFAVDGKLFDIGNQTAHALTEIEHGVDPLTRVDDEWANGNGALMRGLPAALVANNEDHAVKLGGLHSIVTHSTENSISTCKVYASLAYNLLYGVEFEDALQRALVYASAELLDARDRRVRGQGYVIDSFWSAIWALRNGKDYRSVIQYAIALGNDTDTTACIAGGLAGAIYEIPSDWLSKLRGQHLLEKFKLELK